MKYELNWYLTIFTIKDIYYNTFSHDSENDDFYLYWLENNLLLKLNDDLPSNKGVSSKLKKEHPFITQEYLQRNVNVSEINRRISKIWSLMNIKKKIEFAIDTTIQSDKMFSLNEETVYY